MVTQIHPPQIDEQRLRMTYEEFLAWADEDTRAEWVDGEVILFMPQSRRHIRLIYFLIQLVGAFASLRRLGEVYGEPFEIWTRPKEAFRRPDITFLRTDHLDRFTDEGVFEPVDLVVEVVSPDSVVRDTKDKWDEYARAGVPEYWIVEGREGQRGVAFYELQPNGTYQAIEPDTAGRLHSKVLPGFWLDPVWLDDEPFPNPLDLLRLIAPGELRALDAPGGDTR
jgi:Uma2 family endonuclease